MGMIHTNLNLKDMPNELRNHFKGLTNLKYIAECLKMHFEKRFITRDEYKQLRQEYNV